MTRFHFYLFLFTAVLFQGMSSCSLEKRVYRKGFYIDRNKTAQTFNHQQSSDSVAHSFRSNINDEGITKNEVQVPVNSDSVRTEIVTSDKPVIHEETSVYAERKNQLRKELKRDWPWDDANLKKEDVHRYKNSSLANLIAASVFIALMLAGGITLVFPLFLAGFLGIGICEFIALYHIVMFVKLGRKYPELISRKGNYSGNFSSPYLNTPKKTDPEVLKMQSARKAGLLMAILLLSITGIAAVVVVGIAFAP